MGHSDLIILRIEYWSWSLGNVGMVPMLKHSKLVPCVNNCQETATTSRGAMMAVTFLHNSICELL